MPPLAVQCWGDEDSSSQTPHAGMIASALVLTGLKQVPRVNTKTQYVTWVSSSIPFYDLIPRPKIMSPVQRHNTCVHICIAHLDSDIIASPSCAINFPKRPPIQRITKHYIIVVDIEGSSHRHCVFHFYPLQLINEIPAREDMKVSASLQGRTWG